MLDTNLKQMFSREQGEKEPQVFSMDKFEYKSPVQHFAKDEEAKFRIEKSFTIGLVLVALCFFLSDFPKKADLKVRTGKITRIYNSDIKCGRRSHCMFIDISNTKISTKLVKPTFLDLKVGDSVEVLAEYSTAIDAYRVFEVRKNGSMLWSYEVDLFTHYLFRVLAGIIGFYLIRKYLAIRKKNKLLQAVK